MRSTLLTSLTGLLVLGATALPATQVTINSGSISTMQMGGPAAPTPMARGTGAILGAVVDANGNRPVAAAIVTLSLAGSEPMRVMADGQGQFAFRDLPPGRFSVVATRAGYVDGAFGRVRPSGSPQSIDLVA